MPPPEENTRQENPRRPLARELFGPAIRTEGEHGASSLPPGGRGADGGVRKEQRAAAPRRWRDPGPIGAHMLFAAPPLLPVRRLGVWRSRKQDASLSQLLGTLLQGAGALRDIASLPVGDSSPHEIWNSEPDDIGPEELSPGYPSECDKWACETMDDRYNSPSVLSGQPAPKAPAPDNLPAHWQLPEWCKPPQGHQGGKDVTQRGLGSGLPFSAKSSPATPSPPPCGSERLAWSPAARPGSDAPVPANDPSVPAHWQLPAWCKPMDALPGPTAKAASVAPSILAEPEVAAAFPSQPKLPVMAMEQTRPQAPPQMDRCNAGTAAQQFNATPSFGPPDFGAGGGGCGDFAAGHQADLELEAKMAKSKDYTAEKVRQSSRLSPRSPRGRRA